MGWLSCLGPCTLWDPGDHAVSIARRGGGPLTVEADMLLKYMLSNYGMVPGRMIVVASADHGAGVP